MENIKFVKKPLVTLLAVLFLAASSGCGGGGGDPGGSGGGSTNGGTTGGGTTGGGTTGGGTTGGGTPVVTPLTTTAPSKINLSPNSARVYSVAGGVAPYTVGSGDARVADVTISGINISITAKSAGKTMARIVDAAGTAVEFEIEVQDLASSPLVTTAPSSLSILPGSSISYEISGGTPPYTSSSRNENLVKASVSNSTMSLTSSSGGSGSTVVEIGDKLGQKISVNVSVAAASALRTSAPAAVSVSPGATVSYTVAGGNPPYQAVAGSPDFVDVALSGSNIQLTGKTAGNTAIKIIDKDGAQVEFAVTVGSSIPLVLTAPSIINLQKTASSTYRILGGERPYQGITSNASVAAVVVTDDTFAVTAVENGKADIEITDKLGKKQTISVVVAVPDPAVPLSLNAASPVTMFPSDSSSIAIIGGAAPYQAASSNAAVVTANIVNGALQLVAGQAGTAQVTVRDARGNSANVDFAVAATLPLATTAPGALTVGVGPTAARDFDIVGGVAPYTVQGSNNGAFLVTQTGASFHVEGRQNGDGTISVRDSAGKTIAINVKVGSPEMRISPTALKIFPGVDAVARISGGQPPYKVAGGIPSAVEVKVVNDNELSIRGKLESKLDVSVADATGTTVKIEVEVVAGTGTFNIMPGDISVYEDDVEPITLRVYGATPGQVCFYTDRPLLAPQGANCENNPTSLVLGTGAAGSRCVNGDALVTVTAVDSSGFIAKSRIKIVDNNRCTPAPTMTLGSTSSSVTRVTSVIPIALTTAQILVYGGSGNYFVTSDNGGAATASVAGNVVTITRGEGPAGTATVTVYDQQNPTGGLSIAVTATDTP